MLEFIRLVTEVPRSERKVETRTTYFTFIMGIMAGFDGVSGMVEVYQFRPHMAVSCYSWYTGICVGLYLAAAIAGVVGEAVTEYRMPWHNPVLPGYQTPEHLQPDLPLPENPVQGIRPL